MHCISFEHLWLGSRVARDLVDWPPCANGFQTGPTWRSDFHWGKPIWFRKQRWRKRWSGVKRARPATWWPKSYNSFGHSYADSHSVSISGAGPQVSWCIQRIISSACHSFVLGDRSDAAFSLQLVAHGLVSALWDCQSLSPCRALLQRSILSLHRWFFSRPRNWAMEFAHTFCACHAVQSGWQSGTLHGCVHALHMAFEHVDLQHCSDAVYFAHGQELPGVNRRQAFALSEWHALGHWLLCHHWWTGNACWNSNQWDFHDALPGFLARTARILLCNLLRYCTAFICSFALGCLSDCLCNLCLDELRKGRDRCCCLSSASAHGEGILWRNGSTGWFVLPNVAVVHSLSNWSISGLEALARAYTAEQRFDWTAADPSTLCAAMWSMATFLVEMLSGGRSLLVYLQGSATKLHPRLGECKTGLQLGDSLCLRRWISHCSRYSCIWLGRSHRSKSGDTGSQWLFIYRFGLDSGCIRHRDCVKHVDPEHFWCHHRNSCPSYGLQSSTAAARSVLCCIFRLHAAYGWRPKYGGLFKWQGPYWPNGFLRLMFECHSHSVGQRLHMLRVARLAPVHGHFLCGSSTAVSIRLKLWRVSHVAWY